MVSRAEQVEINSGRGVNGCVMLDMRHLSRELILTRLNQIYELAWDLAGVDMLTNTVPIRPGMHYQMGGVKTDIDGRCTLPGLYAAGECACVSVHGANRLGGNSLLETVVFGRRAGRTAAQEAEEEKFVNLTPAVAHDHAGRIDALLSRSNLGIRAAALRRELGATMQERAGIFRDGAGLSAGLETLHGLRDRYESVSVQDQGSVFNTDLISALELGNMLDLAEVMMASSLARQESRGAHARRDFPDRDDEGWLKHTLATYTPDGPRLDYGPVTITEWQPQARSY